MGFHLQDERQLLNLQPLFLCFRQEEEGPGHKGVSTSLLSLLKEFLDIPGNDLCFNFIGQNLLTSPRIAAREAMKCRTNWAHCDTSKEIGALPL